MAAFAPALGQSLRSRPPRNPNSQKNDNPRQLEFTSAMEDFQKMFPSMDTEVIEAVLRANNGLVDATIDQLLSMGAGDETKSSENFPHLPSYVDTGPREPPPAYSPRESESSDGRPLPARPYSAWNPPLLGSLPDDFLRFTHIPSSRGSPSPAISPSLSTEGNNDKKSEQFLEDEKLAQVLQNEEFVRELSRNKDFMMSLERDKQRNMALNNTSPSETPAPPNIAPSKPAEPPPSNLAVDHQESSLGAVGGPAPQEDVVLREKLKHMGKSTRRKLDKMARIFHRKKNTQKANFMVSGSAASTANLLEEYEDDDDDELLNVMAAGRLEIINDAESETDKPDETKQESSQSESIPPPRMYDPFDPVEFYAEDKNNQYKSEK